MGEGEMEGTELDKLCLEQHGHLDCRNDTSLREKISFFKMGRSIRSHLRFSARHFRETPYPMPSKWRKAPKQICGSRKTVLVPQKKDWEDATCSVCMEYPHNAVLLLCSSHDKGCRPYMCATSYRHSNCLDQFKKAYTKVTPTVANNSGLGETTERWNACENSDTVQLSCPLCRGQVKGWTVVNNAREYLNNKRRSCMQENCSFLGTYKELRKHVRSEHPSAKPREVDPVLEQKWRTLEHERERQDVISTIRSSMPRAMVFGDYVIEANSDVGTDDEVDGDEDFDGRSHGISRSILYLFLQEGTRLMRMHRDGGASGGLMRLHRDNWASEGGEGGGVNGVPAAYYSEGDDNVFPAPNEGQVVDMTTFERRRRRRRRNRARSDPDVS